MSGRAATSSVIPGKYAISVGKPPKSIPEGWAWVALTEVAELGTGHTPSRKHPEYWGGDIPWVGIKDAALHHGGVVFTTAENTNVIGIRNSSARIHPPLTVCLSRTASVGYVFLLGREMATSQDFVTWTCSENIDPYFLQYALIAEGKDIRRFGKGSTHTTIYFPEVKAFHISLPPISEQRRIIEKVDRLQSRSARARDELGPIPRLIERYKQAVLTKAFRGELTASETFHSVPFGELVASTKNGLSKRVGQEGEPVNVLRLADLQEGRFSPSTPRQIVLDAEERHTFNLVDGDLVCIRVNGSANLVGRMFVFNSVDEWSFCDHFIRFRLNKGMANPLYVASYFSSEQARRELESWFVSTAGQKTVSQKSLGKMTIPLPSLEVQREVVEKVAAAHSWIDRIAQEQENAASLLAKLDQAVLAKAFRGELVPQDPNDEPASVLLERVRAERANQPKPKRGRKKKEEIPS